MKLKITVQNQSEEKKYIKAVSVNGKVLSGAVRFVRHSLNSTSQWECRFTPQFYQIVFYNQ